MVMDINDARVPFTNAFPIATQIRWKIRFTAFPLLANVPLQIFTHAATAQLSYHVQNFVAIYLSIREKYNLNHSRITIEKGPCGTQTLHIQIPVPEKNVIGRSDSVAKSIELDCVYA